MRPSLKPRNLAISTGDLFCSDELNHAGGNKSGSKIIRETHMYNMHEEKSHDWKEIYTNCDFGLSSEPRAKDVRRKPILAERKRDEEWKGMKEWVNARRMQQRTTSERERVKDGVERRGVNVLKKIAKKSEEIIQREPTSLPTGRSAYMYCKVKTSKW